MELILYPLLNARSKRAILRTKKKWGHPVTYTPKAPLIERLSQETGLSSEETILQLENERAFLTKYREYFR